MQHVRTHRPWALLGLWVPLAILAILVAPLAFAEEANPAAATEVAVEVAEAPAEVAEPTADPAKASCGNAQAPVVLADIIIIADPEPVGICNCNPENEAVDCKRVCGEAGGSCLVTIPCEDPNTYSGWCKCNARPVQVR